MNRSFFYVRFLKNLILFLTLLISVTSASEHACGKCKYGFRRAHTTRLVIQTGENLEWDAEKLFYRDISDTAEELRRSLIDSDAFGIEEGKKKDEKESPKTRNIACFAFVFFDQEGKQVGDKPYFYKPKAIKDNVTVPFFFFSGRRHRTYVPSDGPYGWDALSETAIKEEDGNYRFFPEKRMELFKDPFDSAYIELFKSMETTFTKELELFVWRICDKEPLFDYLRAREQRKIKREICDGFFEPVKPHVSVVKIQKKAAHYRPVKDTQDFIHSEQFALYKMSFDFDSFIDSCVEHLGEKASAVKKVGTLIYTRNTMCCRCGHSIITDFHHSDDSENFSPFLTTLKNKFRDQPLEFLFVAAALYPYESNVGRLDNFEREIRGVPIVADKEDMTFKVGGFIPSFTNLPEMIYHYHFKKIEKSDSQSSEGSLKPSDVHEDVVVNLRQNPSLDDVVETLQPSSFTGVKVLLRENSEGLPIHAKPINTIGGLGKEYSIDGKKFKLQNVSGTSMRCFFNTLGLIAVEEIGKLRSKGNDVITRYMIANEIISAARTPHQLPKEVKEAINFTLYEAQRSAIDILEEARSTALAAQPVIADDQDTQALPEVLQSAAQRGDDALDDLRKRAQTLEAYKSFLTHHILKEEMMVTLHDVQGDLGGNENSNFTSIDAVAYVNNLGIRIFQINPKMKDELRLLHQFIPQGAAEIAYVYYEYEGAHFQALIPQ